MADDRVAQSSGRPGFDPRVLVTSLRRHFFIYLVGITVMIGIDMWNPADKWAAWPVMIWSAFLGIHFMAKKTLTVDEGWVDERAGDVLYKAYDAGHMTDIKIEPAEASVGHRDGDKAGEVDAQTPKS
jgi:hypothetical protein